MKKIRVGVFFGGRSSEHEISIRSATSIVKSLDKDKYDIVLVGTDKQGRFYFGESAIALNMPLASEMLEDLRRIDYISAKSSDTSIGLPEKVDESISRAIDVAFPVFHGPFGEDGTIQGLLQSFNVPYVGAGVLGSAIGMDKDITKRLLRDAGIPSAKHLTFYYHELESIKYNEIISMLGDTIFVKPANLGSSVGVSKVKSKDNFEKALKTAFLYDNKIIVEEFIRGREIECSVLGNEYPEASVLGEIIVKHEFYSYSAKYLSEDGADLKIPADLPVEISDKIRKMAVQVFKILACEGMARIDFFVKDNFEILANEINTIPGFTEEISMYPKLWEASGVPYKELLDRLINLAISRSRRNNKLCIDH
ncbi:MAG: D-alanine--D-alanine ligase [Holosporaceae bacterium]|jgi:D-alanine-D-alanine ligase|nr:D-alanine--D-alanine ligase [Holosporaceae bacterium]